MKIFSSFTLCLVALLLLPSQSFIDAQTTLSVPAQVSAIQAIIDTLEGFLSGTTTCVGTLTSIITYLTGALLNPPNPTVGALLTTLLGNVQNLVAAILIPGCLSNLKNFLNGTINALKNEINNLQSTTTKPSTTPSSSPTTTTTPTQSSPQTTTVEPETTPTQPPQTTQGPETTIEITSTAESTTPQVTTEEPTTSQVTTEEPTTSQVTTEESTTPQVTTEEPTTVSQEVCTNCELPSTDPNNPKWTNYSASTCDGFDPNTASLYSPVILDNSTTEQCQKLIQCNFAEGEVLYAIVTYVATNATWCVPLQLDSETPAFPLICNSSIGQYEDIFGWAIYHVIGCGNGVSTATTEAPTTSTPAPDCEVPDEVCAVLMIDQSIVLPILDYLNDPIALVQVFLTNGNCSDDSSGIEHGSTFVATCPMVSGVAGFFSSFFEMIGVQMLIQDYIDQAGFYVTTFQTAFNAIFSSVQAGVDGVTTQMCPEWIPDDVTTTTASP